MPAAMTAAGSGGLASGRRLAEPACGLAWRAMHSHAFTCIQAAGVQQRHNHADISLAKTARRQRKRLIIFIFIFYLFFSSQH